VNRHLGHLPLSTRDVIVIKQNAPPRIKTNYAHPVDVVRELSPLILVNSMADVCIGALHGDLASLGGHGRCLRAELNVELPDEDCVSCER
jgi:hypothetical protein